MQKTTVYLPDELKTALARAARRRGVSEAAIIRSAVQSAVQTDRPRPSGGLYAGHEPIAGRVDEALAGFGKR